jgi:hypothetical protein
MKNPIRIYYSGLLVLLILLGSTSVALAQSQPGMNEVSREAVGEQRIEEVVSMAEEIMTAMSRDGYYPYTEETATALMVEQLTEENQKMQLSQIQTHLGDYQDDLEFMQAYEIINGPNELMMYRLKGDFSKATTEVRMVYDSDQKIAGMLVVPWSEKIR